MKKSSFFLISLFIIISSDYHYSQNSFFQKSPFKYSYGDNLKWKEINFNDSSWSIVFNNTIDSKADYCWIRTNIYLSKTDVNFKDLVLLIDMSVDYEIYWNGDKFGQNFVGSFGNIIKEGIYSESFSLNDSLLFLGKNVISIRAKLNKSSPLEIIYFNIADPIDIKLSEYKVFGHLFFLTLVYFILLVLLLKFFRKNMTLFFNGYLIMSILIMIISLFIEYLFFAGLVSYNFSFIGEKIIVVLSFLSLFSISLFFFEINKIKNQNIYLILIGSALAICFYFDLDKYYYLSIGLIPPFLTVYFYQEKKSFLKYYGILFFAIILFFNIAFGISIMKLFFLVVLFYLSVIYFRKEEAYKNGLVLAKLRSARLENEMLKKIIQPHYILNSLNAILDLLEEAPKSGLRFIKELSEEFQTFLQVSDKKLIPIKEEIKLCKHHAKIMSFRQEKEYLIKTEISNLNNTIPPTIFHTLVENGITHNKNRSNKVCFIIWDEEITDGIKYNVLVDYSGSCNKLSSNKFYAYNKNDNSSVDLNESTGLNYIKSRLSESYDNKWEMNYSGNDKFWLTEITIHNI